MLKIIVPLLALSLLLGASNYENGDEAYEDGDIKSAISYWEKGSKAGELESQFMLGLLYLRGDDVTPDIQKAASLLANTFAQDDETLQITVALVYYKNRGHTAQDKKAIELFEAAVDKEGKVAQYNLGMLFVDGSAVAKDMKKGAYFIKKSKDANYTKALQAWKKYNLSRY